jgi:putative membrane protein
VRPLTDLARLLPLLAGLLILHSHTGSGLVWGIAASVIAVVTGVVHWATTRYQVTDERVYLRRGLLNQKVLSVARDRIRTVDVTAHLLHRVLGVCRVSIGTGRNDLRPGESFHLDGLTRATAESLRDLLLAQLPAGPAQLPAGPAQLPAGPAQLPAGAQPSDAVPAELAGPDGQIVQLRTGWVRFAPLTMTGLVVLGVLVGSILQISNATDVNLANTGPVRVIFADFSALPLSQRILAMAVTALVGYVLVATIGYLAVFWNFRLVRQGTDTLRVTRGLLSTRATTISLGRLRGVEISEPLLLRTARGARCIAITTGLHVGRGAEREGSVLLPPAPRHVASAVAAEVLGIPERVCTGSLVQHGPIARRRRYIRALAGAALIVALIATATRLGHGSAWIWIVSLGLLPVAAALAADRYRSLGHLLADGWLVTRVGSVIRRRSIISTDAIIGWRVHQTWFQRRLGLVTLTATTAAGRQRYSVQDVPVTQALAVAAAATSDLVLPFLAATGNSPVTPEPDGG